MKIRVACECGRAYNLGAEFAGKKVTCKHCGAKFRIPASINGGEQLSQKPDFDAMLDEVLNDTSSAFAGVASQTQMKNPDAELELSPVISRTVSFEDPEEHLEALAASSEESRDAKLQKATASAPAEYLAAWKLILVSMLIGGVAGLILFAIILSSGSDGFSSPVFALVFLPLIGSEMGFVAGAVWRVYEKADFHGASSLIPIYNIMVLHEIAGLPWWLIVGWLIPGVNLLLLAVVYYGIARNFGKGIPFAFGMLTLGFIFVPVLAFGKSEYRGDWSLFGQAHHLAAR